MSTLTRPRSGAPRVEIDPRFDERRRAVTRRHSRKRAIVIGAGALVALFAAGAWPLLHSRLFSADHIVVSGNAHTPTSAILGAAGLAQHPPLIDVHAGAAERAIDALPWVASATVRVHWPTGVSVAVRERRPVAVAPAGAGIWAELDSTGRVLTTTSGAPVLPELSGLARPGAAGSTLGSARPLLAVAARLPAAFKAMVQTMAPSPKGGGVDLSLAGGIGVVFGTPTQLPAKFEDIASILAGAKLAPGNVIDVSVPDSPAVAGGGATKG